MDKERERDRRSLINYNFADINPAYYDTLWRRTVGVEGEKNRSNTVLIGGTHKEVMPLVAGHERDPKERLEQDREGSICVDTC